MGGKGRGERREGRGKAEEREGKKLINGVNYERN